MSVDVNGIVPLLTVGLGFGLGFGLVFGLIGVLFGGLRRGIIDVKAIPNLGIKLSMRNAMLAGALALLVFGLILGLILGMDFALSFGLAVGLIAFFWYGGQDVIQHYILRIVLYWKGYTPLRYANFLDYAARLVFLQKVGGGYIFIHRLLLEHFATMRRYKKETALTAVNLRSADHQDSRQFST
jgi:hypothetical protein